MSISRALGAAALASLLLAGPCAAVSPRYRTPVRLTVAADGATTGVARSTAATVEILGAATGALLADPTYAAAAPFQTHTFTRPDAPS